MDNEANEILQTLRDRFHSEAAQLQVVGRSLGSTEMKRVEALNQSVIALDEVRRLLREAAPTASAEAMTVGESVSSPVSWTQRQAFAEVIAAIKAHRAELEKIPGVVSVRPGYRYSNGDFTGIPAIVVAVRRQRSLETVPLHERLPRKIGNVWVNVTEASPEEQLQAQSNAVPAATGAEEVTAASGAGGEIAEWESLLDGSYAATPAVFAENITAEAATRYRKPPHLSLEPTRVDKMICHVSPDAGWRLLSSFLAGVEERLTVAMYDFHAPYIEETLQTAMQRAGGDLRLIIDSDNQAQDIEDDFLQLLKTALGKRFISVWASTGGNGLFKSAYHTKVVVRDGQGFWLSSGNWTKTSQPDLNLNAPSHNLYTKGNREWHVIVEDESLSKTFEDYINYDIEEAEKQSPGTESLPPLPDLLLPMEDFAGESEAVAARQPFAFEPQTFEDVRVQPLLTPDNYIDHILALIDSAREKLYLQYSYIRFAQFPSKFQDLIHLLRDKTQSNVDVRIIVGRNQKPVDTDKLFAIGLDSTCFRLQKSKLHNKGILVDSKKAVVGSHNWSFDGTLFNRDASLIIDDARVAGYYESIFVWDWNNITSPVGTEEAMPRIATGNTTPVGMTRVAWRSYYEE